MFCKSGERKELPPSNHGVPPIHRTHRAARDDMFWRSFQRPTGSYRHRDGFNRPHCCNTQQFLHHLVDGTFTHLQFSPDLTAGSQVYYAGSTGLGGVRHGEPVGTECNIVLSQGEIITSIEGSVMSRYGIGSLKFVTNKRMFHSGTI